MDPSIGQRMNVSGLSCVSNKVLGCWDSYKGICDFIHHQESTVYVALVLGVPVYVLQHSSVATVGSMTEFPY